MENRISEKSYKEAKKKAKEFYSSIGSVWCPILESNVVFSSIGFRHLVSKGGISRPKSEQKRRFVLLSLVKDILEDKMVNISHEEKTILRRIKIGGKRISVSSAVHFWEISKVQDGKNIIIVIRQFENQEKHFLSIYERTRKPSH